MADDLLLIQRPDAPLGDKIVAAIRDAISVGALVPGQRLTERELMERTGVSRTSVREALRQLRTLGLVEEAPRGGLQVAVLDRATVEHIYEVRSAIEPVVAKLFTIRAGDDEVAEFIEVGKFNQTLTAPPADLASFDKPTAAKVLIRGARNPLLGDIIDTYHVRIQWLRRVSLSMPGRWEQGRAEMMEVADAVQRRKPGEAARATRRHVAAAQKAALLALSQSQVDAETLTW
ncbi:MAG: GntR family transcriptional regulator [Actinobacteria bacterium]|nr:GntR family transcriptional regulator [Actinomycetota bacterium]